jgi:signal transduction histidine kinase
MAIKPEDWTIFIILGIGMFLLMVLLFSLLLFIRIHVQRIRQEEAQKFQVQLEHQQALSTAMIEAQERERARLAGELHDGLVSQLYRVKLSNDNPKVNELLLRSIRNARALSHELSPPLLEQLSMEDLLLDYLAPFEKKYKVETSFKKGQNKAVKTATKLQLFRIFQEVLTNIDKYAQAQAIRVVYRFYDTYLCLSVSDDGVGFDPTTTTGLGLKNIRLRTQVLQGVCKLSSQPSEGTRFTFLRYQAPKKS